MGSKPIRTHGDLDVYKLPSPIPPIPHRPNRPFKGREVPMTPG